MKSVAIYGGGNIAHSLAAILSCFIPVCVFTRRPQCWSDSLLCEQAGTSWRVKFPIRATSDIDDAADVDIMFVSLPQFALDEVVDKLCSRLKAGTTIVFVPAPAKCEEYVKRLTNFGIKVVAFQRVPFISRIIQYGSVVRISEPRELHRIAVSDDSLKDEWTHYCESWFHGKVEFLASFLIFAFSNSNPLLHPARLVVLLKGGECGCYAECPYFYSGWTDESSELYLRADYETREVFHTYATPRQLMDYVPVTSYYGVSSARELTAKIRSIEGFKHILAPWRRVGKKWSPDFSSRYFVEDVPYGTDVIRSYAHQAGLKTPVLDSFVAQCQNTGRDRV